MLKQLNLRVFIKCFQTALVMTLLGIIAQVIKGQLIFKLPRPEIGFIIGVFVSYMLVAMLYSIAFFIFRNALPGKTPVQKGLFYALLCSLAVLIPGILGMTAFDFAGRYTLLTAYKMEQYFILLVDTVNFFIGGQLLAQLFKDDLVFIQSKENAKKGIVMISFLGAIIFPLLMLFVHRLAEVCFTLGLTIPTDAKQWYYIALNVPLLLTGGILPCFYYQVKEAFSGSWIKKSISFFLVFYFCYWFMNLGFMINFSISLQYVGFMLAISFVSLFFVILMNGWIIEKISKEMDTGA